MEKVFFLYFIRYVFYFSFCCRYSRKIFFRNSGSNILKGSFYTKENNSNKVALVSVKGVILSSEDLVESLDEIENNDEIVGIILRINSPGGAVAPVQEIYEKLLRIRETKTIYSSFPVWLLLVAIILLLIAKIFANAETVEAKQLF